MKERNKGIWALVLAAMIWSTAGIFIKWLPQDAFTILCFRALYTMGVFALVFRSEVLRFNKQVGINALFYAGLLICFVLANKLTTAANAIFLQYTGVAYVLLLEPWLFKLRYERINIVTTIVCFAGMSLFFLEGLDASNSLGIAIAALSGVMYAGFVLGQRKSPAEYHVGSIFWGNVLVALVGFPSFLGASPTGQEHLMLAYLGILQMGVGYLLFTYGLQRTTGTEAALLTMLEPLFNPVWVAIGYDEWPSRLAIFGGMLLVLALVVRTLILQRRNRKLLGTNNG